MMSVFQFHLVKPPPVDLILFPAFYCRTRGHYSNLLLDFYRSSDLRARVRDMLIP